MVLGMVCPPWMMQWRWVSDCGFADGGKDQILMAIEFGYGLRAKRFGRSWEVQLEEVGSI